MCRQILAGRLCIMDLKMLNAVRGIARCSLVLLLLYAVVCAQTATLSAEHSHNSSQHCCGLCHVGPLPFLQPVVASALAPGIASTWLVSASYLDSPHEVLLTTGSSRAPPA
jgi:hypothetical protein